MQPLGPFAPDRRIAVAVSGGADSMALALLAKIWGRPYALIVDHGLRPGSAAEAALTLDRLRRIAIPARVLTLSGLSRGSALHVRARAARYAALQAACAEAGLADLLLGHHAADQAETLAMRVERGSGPAGRAGMAALTTRGTIRLLRPLLRVDPARLRAAARHAGLGWVDDPGNRDPATRRAGLRAGPLLVPDEAWRYGVRRAASEARRAGFLARCATIHPEGYARFGDEGLQCDALAAIAWTISGRAYPPSPAMVERIVANPGAASFHGVLLRRWQGQWLVAREPASVAPAVPAQSGSWDGRFRLAPGARPPPGAQLGAVGADAARLRRLSPLPSLVLQGLPAVRCDGALFAVPFLGYPDKDRCDMVPVAFCVSHPLAAEPFVAA